MLTTDDVLAPKGKLTEAMFPDGDLDELAEAWLAEAQERTSHPRAQRAWVYYRAYEHILDRVMLEAFSERKGDASATRHEAQLAHWRRARDRHHAEYASLTGSSTLAGGHRPVKAAW